MNEKKMKKTTSLHDILISPTPDFPGLSFLSTQFEINSNEEVITLARKSYIYEFGIIKDTNNTLFQVDSADVGFSPL